MIFENGENFEMLCKFCVVTFKLSDFFAKNLFCRYSDTHKLHVSFTPVIVACYSHCMHLTPCNDCMLFTLCVFNTL